MAYVMINPTSTVVYNLYGSSNGTITDGSYYEWGGYVADLDADSITLDEDNEFRGGMRLDYNNVPAGTYYFFMLDTSSSEFALTYEVYQNNSEIQKTELTVFPANRRDPIVTAIVNAFPPTGDYVLSNLGSTCYSFTINATSNIKIYAEAYANDLDDEELYIAASGLVYDDSVVPPTPTPSGSIVKRYNGSTFEDCNVYYYDGTEFVLCDVKRYDGSTWTDIDE